MRARILSGYPIKATSSSRSPKLKTMTMVKTVKPTETIWIGWRNNVKSVVPFVSDKTLQVADKKETMTKVT
jgi:hypothetical protein